MEKQLSQLSERLTKAFGGNLVSLVLYGSAAASGHQQRFSDLNVFCVLGRLGPDELAAAEPVFSWWRSKGNPAPLLMSLDELNTATDCFPIEFHDMVERNRLLAGADVLSALEIHDHHYRAQVEHELRAKLLRLRQKAPGVLADRELLVRLMADSASTFLVLGRHALRLAGAPAPHAKREIAASLAEAFGFDPRAFYALLDFREGKPLARDVDPPALFARYLEEVNLLVAAVDRIER
jgi:hypothetical protein